MKAGNAGAEGDAEVKVAVGFAVPGATETAAALGLAAGEDGEGGGAAGAELAGGFVVGAVGFVEDEEGEAARADFELGFDEDCVGRGGFGREAVAAGALGLEGEAGGAEFFHVVPDRDAADAEFGGEGCAGHPARIVGEEFAEDQVFGGGHGAEDGGRKTERGRSGGRQGQGAGVNA